MAGVMEVPVVPAWLAGLGALVVAAGLWVVVRMSPLRRRAVLAGGPGRLEVAAMVLLLAGGFLVVGWLVGCVLLWVSPRWRWADKLAGTLVWPGGLVPAWVLGSVTPSLLGPHCRVFPAGPGAPAECFYAGPSPWVVVTALVVLVLGPLVVTVWLWRRARTLPGAGVAGAGLAGTN